MSAPLAVGANDNVADSLWKLPDRCRGEGVVPADHDLTTILSKLTPSFVTGRGLSGIGVTVAGEDGRLHPTIGSRIVTTESDEIDYSSARGLTIVIEDSPIFTEGQAETAVVAMPVPWPSGRRLAWGRPATAAGGRCVRAATDLPRHIQLAISGASSPPGFKCDSLTTRPSSDRQCLEGVASARLRFPPTLVAWYGFRCCSQISVALGPLINDTTTCIPLVVQVLGDE